METAMKIIAAVVGVYLSLVFVDVATDNMPSFVWQLILIFVWIGAVITFLWFFAKSTSNSE